MAGPVNPFAGLAGEEVTTRDPAGGPMTLEARAEAINGTCVAPENIVAAERRRPLQIHIREDEIHHVLILDGRLRFEVDAWSMLLPTAIQRWSQRPLMEGFLTVPRLGSALLWL